MVDVQGHEHEVTQSRRRAALMMAVGASLLTAALGGLVLLWVAGVPAEDAAARPTASLTHGAADAPGALVGTGRGGTQQQAARVTPLPPPTLIPTPDLDTLFPGATAEPSAAPTAEPTVQPDEGPAPTPPPIVWTQEEKNALGWLCYGEVGGMAERKIDACLSVISTVRARYAYSNGFPETDVLGTLRRPGQFNVTVYTDRPGPDPDLNWAVEQYQAGARGSCNGYLYFDSVPGGPSLCQIYSSGGWIEFHNGW
ncbi:MAG: hypothetical protein Kow00124_21110 [Anaerolineae bacterium]